MRTIVLTGSVVSRRYSELSHEFRFFTKDERLLLEAVFTYNKYPNRATLQDLAKNLAVNENMVRNWFLAKRQNLKKKAIQTGLLPRKFLVQYVHLYFPQ